MDRLFDRMLRKVDQLLEISDWQPTERRQFSFYSEKLESFSKQFQTRSVSTYHEHYLHELLCDRTLESIVNQYVRDSNIRKTIHPPDQDVYFPNLDSVGEGLEFELALIYESLRQFTKELYSQFRADNTEFHNLVDFPNLNSVGDRLAFEVALIYKASRRQDFTKELSSQFLFDNTKFQQQEAIDQAIFMKASSKAEPEINSSFKFLIVEMERLLKCRNWLPLERCQVSFYRQMLKFVATRNPINPSCRLARDRVGLCDLVSRILDYKNVTTSVEFLKFHDPPDLTLIGDNLAIQVHEIYSHDTQFFWEDLELDPQFFASKFYFEKNIFQEFLFDEQAKGEVFIGFQVEAEQLLEKLACITKKQLEVISIVGMGGLGKTTLAKRLYNDPYVVSHFYVRAWVTCSQIYNKRDLLLAILRSVIEVTDDDVFLVNDNKLAHDLYHALEGKRFLIVIDDIWSTEAWDDLKRSFPCEYNGSKIMLTSRLKDVALHAQSDGNPLCLRFMTEEESFDLFRVKAFTPGRDFEDLNLIGKSIIRKCHGLPLTIVVIAGLLKNNFNIHWWEQVAESVSSYIATDENQYTDTLALSYNHLPEHLRTCFLSFGTFSEDHDIPVCRLIYLWIAEGFIHQDGTNKNLEAIAEDYLMDLIGRSLVVIGKRGCNGATKTCRIHDLLRDLCIQKAKEENFSANIYKYNKHILVTEVHKPSSSTNPSAKSQLFLHTDVLNVPAFCVCSSSDTPQSILQDVSIIWDTSKLVQALDLSSIELFVFPSAILELVKLRYLELRFRSGNLPESISQLRELQTLVMSSRINTVVPENMWKMVNLRHICIKSGENIVNLSDVEEPSLLENLQTVSQVSPTRPCQKFLARTPNLQKLGLCGPFTTESGDLRFPDLAHLNHLKKLKLLNTIPLRKSGRLSDSFIFPESLKCLTLSNTYLDWDVAWAFELIPNLEVLKFKFHAFFGKHWETSPEAFRRLKFLKLDELDIVTWTASRRHFPVLQRLHVYRCPYLMEIPEDFGNIYTLEWIELGGCSEAAANSARDMQEEQKRNGNDCLTILHIPGHC